MSVEKKNCIDRYDKAIRFSTISGSNSSFEERRYLYEIYRK